MKQETKKYIKYGIAIAALGYLTEVLSRGNDYRGIELTNERPSISKDISEKVNDADFFIPLTSLGIFAALRKYERRKLEKEFKF